ncbi:winged helix-turn-helix transcriptional regulator [Sporanaerobacter sp. PP17-6a]|uniref:winged helix-turn-helix transcriptional regulator n=1 Tax=Sporanaerobacter sp. PP17-6a TaxID=1891289 RepID=UPI0008A00718|nr:helix-turn-helix domain-containing protein [Sporanaerobacter sp. PP17-6a]SCL88696.1 HTH-type transcriptional activator HxlR [Sporanaerobacter sp. PP17-6a]
MQQDLFGICPYVTAQKLLTGKWTLLILHHLSEKTMRFNELKKVLPDLTQSTLTKQLRMMEKNGLIIRTVYNQIPPKVEYSLSPLGKHFKPVLDALEIWGEEYIEYLKSNKG